MIDASLHFFLKFFDLRCQVFLNANHQLLVSLFIKLHPNFKVSYNFFQINLGLILQPLE